MITRTRQFLSGSGLGPLLVRASLGSAWVRIASMGLTFLVGVQLARDLGAKGYGIYGVAMAAITLLTVPANFGMPQLLIREVAAAQAVENWGRLRGVLQWAVRSVGLLSLAITGGIFLWLLVTDHHLHKPLSMTLLAGVLMVPVVALGRLLAGALLGLHVFVRGQLPDAVIRPAAFSLFLLAGDFLLNGLTPASAMLLGVGSAVVALAVVAVYFKKAVPAATWRTPAKVDTRGWWGSALPMALTEGMRNLQANIATLVMGALTTAAAVGIFRVASSISVMVSIPLTLFSLVGGPLISKLYTQGDKARLQRLLTWLSIGTTAGSILLTLPFLFGGSRLLGLVFGYDFGASNKPLLILCLGSILYSVQGTGVMALNMTGHEKRVTRAFMISVLVLLIISAPLIHFYADQGAAWASVISLLLGNELMRRDTRKYLNLDPSLLSMRRARLIGVP